MTDRLVVTVFDYGAGNLHSLIKALARALRAAVAPDTRRAGVASTKGSLG